MKTNSFSKGIKKTIKKIRIKFNIKTKWNQMMRDKIEEEKKGDKFDIKINWNQMLSDEIKNKVKLRKG